MRDTTSLSRLSAVICFNYASLERSSPVDEIKNGIRAELGEFATWPRERAIPATAEQIYRELPAR